MHERSLNIDRVMPTNSHRLFLPICLKLIFLHLILQIACGKGAGAFTCLLDETGRYGPDDFSVTGLHPDFKVDSLSKILNILETNFDLSP